MVSYWARFSTYHTSSIARSWNPTSIDVKVVRDSVLEVVDRDGLCVLERSPRRHQEVCLTYRKQLVFDAFWFTENSCMQRIEGECQGELPAFGFYFVTDAGALVSTFILGHVERKRRIGFRQVRDRDCSKVGQDCIEHLPVEAISRSSVRQHRESEIRIRQNPQTSALTDGAAVVRVDNLAVPMIHGETEGPLRSEQVGVRYGNTRLHHLANGLGRDNPSPVWRLAPVKEDVRHREHFPRCRVDVASRAESARQGNHW